MRIIQVEYYKTSIELKKPFVISLEKFTHSESIFVIVKTDSGIDGFGECNPFSSIHGETPDTCLIVGKYLSKFLLDRDPLDIEGIHGEMNLAIYGNSSIKSAIEIALIDIVAKNAGMPLYKFLKGENNKEIVTDFTVSYGPIKEMVEDANIIKNLGFQIIKVKLGGSVLEDVKRIKSIRSEIGNNIPIRIDANQAWSVRTAISILNKLSDCNIEFCEEPIPRWDFMELPFVRKNSPIPIMADESCVDHHDAQRLINIGACDFFNVKIGKSGILNSQKIIRLAKKNNIKVQIGGFIESRLGFTAAAHLALSNSNIKFFDFDTPLMLKEDKIVGGIKYEKNGKIVVPEEIGIGASIDPKHLRNSKRVIVSV